MSITKGLIKYTICGLLTIQWGVRTQVLALSNSAFETKHQVSQYNQEMPHSQTNTTGPHSTVGKASDCRSRGRKFDPGQVPYFRGSWSWNNFYGHFPPFLSFMKGWCQLQAKVCALVKLAQEKSVVRWTDHPDMTIAIDWDVKYQTKSNKGTVRKRHMKPRQARI